MRWSLVILLGMAAKENLSVFDGRPSSETHCCRKPGALMLLPMESTQHIVREPEAPASCFVVNLPTRNDYKHVNRSCGLRSAAATARPSACALGWRRSAPSRRPPTPRLLTQNRLRE